MTINPNTIRILYIINDPVTPLFEKYGGLPSMLKNAFEIMRKAAASDDNDASTSLRRSLFPDFLISPTLSNLEIEPIHAYVHRQDKEATAKLFPPVASLFFPQQKQGQEEEQEVERPGSRRITKFPRKYDCIILSGSVRMVSDREPWANAEAEWIREVVATKRMPVLGICFGHQLLGQEVFGGACEKHESGGEWGVFPVKFSESAKADPVFGPIASRVGEIKMSITHSQSVRKLPTTTPVVAAVDGGEISDPSVICGFTQDEPCHLVRYNKITYGFQGHPEYRSGYLKEELALHDGEEEAANRPSQKEEDDISPALLVNFLAFAKNF